MNRKRIIADLVLQVLIVLSALYAVGIYFVGGPGQPGIRGIQCLRYFTTDSNLLAAVTSVFMLAYGIRKLKDPDTRLPRWMLCFRFAGVVSVTVTFLTVVFFLAPTAALRDGIVGYFRLFAGNTFVLHFSTPVLAIVSLTVCERESALSRRESLWGLAPTAVYSVWYIIMVVILREWPDFYGFTFGGKFSLAPASLTGMYLATVLIGLILRRLRGNGGKNPDDGTAAE